MSSRRRQSSWPRPHWAKRTQARRSSRRPLLTVRWTRLCSGQWGRRLTNSGAPEHQLHHPRSVKEGPIHKAIEASKQGEEIEASKQGEEGEESGEKPGGGVVRKGSCTPHQTLVIGAIPRQQTFNRSLNRAICEAHNQRQWHRDVIAICMVNI